MLRELLPFLTLGTVIFYAPIIQAQQAQEQKVNCPNYSTVITVNVVDPYTVICRIIDPEALNSSSNSGLGKTFDLLELYRKPKGINPDFTAELRVYGYGIRRVTLREHKYKQNDATCIDTCTDIAQFLIVNRKFREWIPGYVNPSLLNKYRNYVSLLIDSFEKHPQENPEF